MSATKHNKQTIEKSIYSLGLAVKMEAHIRQVMEGFKHYKRVDNRFIDALTASGLYHAHITKDTYSLKFTVYPIDNTVDYNARVDFTVYLSQVFSAQPLTWDIIEADLTRYDYQKELDNTIAMSQAIEAETVKMQELVNYMEGQKFTCFDLYNIKSDLKDLLSFAKKAV